MWCKVLLDPLLQVAFKSETLPWLVGGKHRLRLISWGIRLLQRVQRSWAEPELDKNGFPTDLLCGECSGEKGMEKYYRLIEVPNKYSVNLEKREYYSLNINFMHISKLSLTSTWASSSGEPLFLRFPLRPRDEELFLPKQNHIQFKIF